MENFSQVNQENIKALNNNDLIHAALARGFANFRSYCADDMHQLSDVEKNFFDKLLKHSHRLSEFLYDPEAFKQSQDDLYVYIDKHDQRIDNGQQLFFEFMIGLCRFELASMMTLEFCKFCDDAIAWPEIATKKTVKQDYWSHLHLVAQAMIDAMALLAEHHPDFAATGFWDNAVNYFKQNPLQQQLAKYVVSMHHIPNNTAMLALAQTLHWGGFGGGAEFIKDIAELQPLMDHVISYHAKGEGGFNVRYAIKLRIHQMMKNAVSELLEPLLQKQFASRSVVNILDVGSGPTYLGAKPIVDLLHKQHKQVKLTATDIDPNSLQALIELQQIDVILSDVRYLDLTLVKNIVVDESMRNQFQIVVGSLVLHQTSQQQIIEAMRFFVEVIEPGGFLVNLDVGEQGYYQCFIMPCNQTDREGFVPHYRHHQFSLSAQKTESNKVKILYPLWQSCREYPQPERALCATQIFQVLEIEADQLAQLQALWDKQDYAAANQLVVA